VPKSTNSTAAKSTADDATSATSKTESEEEATASTQPVDPAQLFGLIGLMGKQAPTKTAVSLDADAANGASGDSAVLLDDKGMVQDTLLANGASGDSAVLLDDKGMVQDTLLANGASGDSAVLLDDKGMVQDTLLADSKTAADVATLLDNAASLGDKARASLPTEALAVLASPLSVLVPAAIEPVVTALMPSTEQAAVPSSAKNPGLEAMAGVVAATQDGLGKLAAGLTPEAGKTTKQVGDLPSATSAVSTLESTTQKPLDMGAGLAQGGAQGQAKGEPKADLTAVPMGEAALGAAQKKLPSAADFATQLAAADKANITEAPTVVAANGNSLQVAVPNLGAKADAAPVHIINVATPVLHPRWVEDVGQHVNVMMNTKLESAQLQVNPPNMGPVDITLKMGPDGAQLSFVAAVPETRQALEDGLARLSTMLADNGIQLSEANVSSGQPQSGQNAQAQANDQLARQQNGQGGRQGQGSGNGEVEVDAEILGEVATRSMPLPDGALSIRV
jgi:flagellar hook-length control protein FliK